MTNAEGPFRKGRPFRVEAVPKYTGRMARTGILSRGTPVAEVANGGWRTGNSKCGTPVSSWLQARITAE